MILDGKSNLKIPKMAESTVWPRIVAQFAYQFQKAAKIHVDENEILDIPGMRK